MLAGYARLTVFLATSVLATACSNIPIHSASRESQAQAAQKAWTDADALSVVAVERDNTAAILKRELAQTEKSTLVGRDAKLLAMVLGPLGRNLRDPVNAAVDAIAPDAFFDGLQTAQSNQRRFDAAMKRVQTAAKRSGFEPFSCADLGSDKARETVNDWLTAELKSGSGVAQELDAALTDAKRKCSPWPATGPQKKPLIDLSFEDSTAVRDYVAKQQAATEPTKQSALLRELVALHAAEKVHAEKVDKDGGGIRDRNTYRVALLEYQRVLDPPSPSASAAGGGTAKSEDKTAKPEGTAAATEEPTPLRNALTKLQTAIAKLKGYEDKLSLKLLADERVDAINGVLSTLLSPKAADDSKATDKDRAALAAERLSKTWADWQAVQVSAQEMRLRPLVVQQTIDQLQSESLSRAIALEEVQLQLQRVGVQLLEQQAVQYQFAKGRLAAGIVQPDSTLQQVIADKSVSSADKGRLFEAAAYYGYATGPLEAQRRQSTLKKNALTDANTLAISDNSIRQWEAVIGGHVDLLTAWAASGVTEQAITNLINSILLAVIAVRTN